MPFDFFRIPNCNAKCRHRPEVRQVLLVAACISVAAAWFVLRKERLELIDFYKISGYNNDFIEPMGWWPKNVLETSV